uniref:Uncharacterized protein n=1 Tax=Rhizophora mucronata TaxID=61149 RepID=A0A2P2M212_RHIMU
MIVIKHIVKGHKTDQFINLYLTRTFQIVSH